MEKGGCMYENEKNGREVIGNKDFKDNFVSVINKFVWFRKAL
jgi:hypothetical protein